MMDITSIDVINTIAVVCFSLWRMGMIDPFALTVDSQIDLSPVAQDAIEQTLEGFEEVSGDRNSSTESGNSGTVEGAEQPSQLPIEIRRR